MPGGVQGTPGAQPGRGIRKPSRVAEQLPPFPPGSPPGGPPVSGLGGWYDASDTATILDAGGGFVARWADKSGYGLDLYQPTGGLQPQTGVRTWNGLNVVTFDGVNDYMQGLSGLSAQPWTALAVAGNTDGTATQRDLFTYADSANFDGRIYRTPADHIALFANLTLDSGTGWGTADPKLVAGIFNSASSTIAVNEGLVTTGDVGIRNPYSSTLTVGAYGGNPATENWQGYLCELIVYPRVLTNAELLAVESYLWVKWFGVPTPLAVQALPQPLQTAQALFSSNPSVVETVPVPRYIQAAPIPEPPPAEYVAFGYPAPIVETVPLALNVAARNVTQPPPAVQVIAGRDASGVETVPVPRFVQSTAAPQATPTVTVTPGPNPSAVETVPLGAYIRANNAPEPPTVNVGPYVALQVGNAPVTTAVTTATTVQTQPIPQPAPTAQVIPGRNPSATPPATPVPVMVASSSIPITAPNVQLLHAPSPSADETVPLGALVRSVPFGQPVQQVQFAQAIVPPVAAAIPTWFAYIQANAIGQKAPLAQLWAVFTAAIVITPPAPGCVHISTSGASITPSSTGQNVTPSSSGASTAVGTVQGSQAGTVMAAAATVTSLLAGLTASTASLSATQGAQTGSAQPSTQAGSATATVSRGSAAVEAATSKVTVDDDKEC